LKDRDSKILEIATKIEDDCGERPDVNRNIACNTAKIKTWIRSTSTLIEDYREPADGSSSRVARA
jgi:hypothetical protein